MLQRFDALEPLVQALASRAAGLERPYVIAVDGRSAAGKTMLAAALAERLDATVIAGLISIPAARRCVWSGRRRW